MQTTEKPNVKVSDGIAAALVFLFIVGLFLGLPVFAWVLWLTLVIGFLIATREIRAHRAAHDPRNVRPWQRH
jgi:hypothetical protein